MRIKDTCISDILDSFPSYKYQIREAQEKVLKNIAAAAFLGIKYIIIQAPTGVGKSAITYTLLDFFKEGTGYVCTNRKALQVQYLNDFKDLREIKGRGNYKCLESNESQTCEKGNCQVLIGYKCNRKPQEKETQYPAYYSNSRECFMYWTGPPEDPGRCHYMVDKVAAINHHAVISNYTYLLTEANYVGELGSREILISDEGHNIEAAIMDFIKVPISEEILDIINKYRHDIPVSFVNTDLYEENTYKLKLHAAWLTDLNNVIIDIVSVIQKRASAEYQDRQMFELTHNMSVSTEKRKEMEEIIQRIEKKLEDLYSDQQKLEYLQKTQIKFFLEDIKGNLRNWVVMETRDSYEKVVKIEFQPIFISPYVQDKFFTLGKLNIIMSATVLNYRIFAQNLGLPVEKVEYIEVKPQFPVENHPIFNLKIADFSFNKDNPSENLDPFYTEVVGRIDMLLDLFEKDKGIIHCTSYEIMDYILNKSRFKNRLITHDQRNREEKLEEHKNSSEPTVLCSPSMTEGVDLKDDFSRFQILVKVPFPDVEDERVKKRNILDKNFYRFKTAMTIIQSIGRSVRSEKDYAVTFTLDSRFESFRKKNRDIMELFNQHVKDNSELEILANLKEDEEFKRKITDPKFQMELLKYIPRKQESNDEEISVNQDIEEE